MEEISRQKRREIATRIMESKERVAIDVTEEFIKRHPEWQKRWSLERIREHGRQDAGYHLDFLAAAVEQSSPAAFQDYVAWAGRVLESRGISPDSLFENIEQIREKLQRDLDDESHRLLHPYFAQLREREGRPPGREEEEDFGEAAEVYLQSLLQGSRKTAVKILEQELEQGESLEGLYLRIIQPVMYQIGRLWERGEISVAQEHMGTAIAQFTMSHLFQRYLTLPAEPLGRVVVTGVAGELHQIGANMVADVLEFRGWDVKFLGTNMPQMDVVSVVRSFEPDWLGISATILANVREVRRLVESIRGQDDIRQPRIVLGGGAFRWAPGMFQEIGADNYAGSLEELSSVFTEAP